MVEPELEHGEDASADERPSKTAAKKAFKEQQGFVRELLDISDRFLIQLGLSEDIIEEIRGARPMTKSARKRQIGFISKQMVDEDVDGARLALERLQQPDAEANQRFHELEDWRDRLIADDDVLLERIVSEQGGDRQQLRALARNARREQDREAAPKSARLLFRYLRQLSEQ